jgi:lipopolysaccharide/colanic/teichoic acid biosynthesis glycosyltransferase
VLHDRTGAGDGVTNRRRLVSLVVVALLPWVARWIHQEYRAPEGTTEAVLPYVLLSLLCVAVVAILEAPPRTSSVTRVFVDCVVATLAVLGASAASQVFFSNSLPRFVIVLSSLLVFVWLMIFGAANAVELRRQGGSERIVAVVSPDDGKQLVQDVEEGPLEQRFTLAAVFTTEGDYLHLAESARQLGVTTLVLGSAPSTHPFVIDAAEELHRDGVRVRSLDDFYDESIGKLPLSSLDRFALMGDIESLHGAYAPLKRTIDVGFALLGSLLLLVLSPIVIIGNLIGNRGPIFFRQERVGLNGKPFRIWKLRTMAPGAIDISGWTSNDDPRITPFGRILRRTHVDELPQVINIFKGDLAVVGPRPEQVAYARQLEDRLPFYAARHLVRPGLTGWAQVKYRYAASEEDAFVKLQYDLHYVRHESLATDLRIIWMTLHHLLVEGGR